MISRHVPRRANDATQSYASHAHLPRLFLVGFAAWAVAVVCLGLMLFGYNTPRIAAGAGLIALFPALAMAAST